jgi:hypothetical protein
VSLCVRERTREREGKCEGVILCVREKENEKEGGERAREKECREREIEENEREHESEMERGNRCLGKWSNQVVESLLGGRNRAVSGQIAVKSLSVFKSLSNHCQWSNRGQNCQWSNRCLGQWSDQLAKTNWSHLLSTKSDLKVPAERYILELIHSSLLNLGPK